MKSKSRASYSSSLTDGEKLIQFLNIFTNYTPGDAELTAAAFQTQTDALRVVQENHTIRHHDYSIAAFDRRKFFDKEDNSIAKLLSPIGSNVRGIKGKSSREYHEIQTLILKIRGEKRVKVTENSGEDTISHSEKSYGSQLIYFGDIITLLTQLGTAFAPMNNKITIVKLQTLLTGATTHTNTVSQKLALYKPLISERQLGFKKLSETAGRIKDMVKSQYGLDSTEYNLVKGLRI
jgi:hypothetical protein